MKEVKYFDINVAFTEDRHFCLSTTKYHYYGETLTQICQMLCVGRKEDDQTEVESITEYFPTSLGLESLTLNQ